MPHRPGKRTVCQGAELWAIEGCKSKFDLGSLIRCSGNQSAWRFRWSLQTIILQTMKSKDDSTRASKTKVGEPNRDPLTGEPGAHPVGTGVGAAAGGATGA